MTEIAVRAEELSKLYRIGELHRRTTLRESIVAAARGAFRPSARRPAETVWALKDVSFEIGRGEVVGIIGRNGAGKSTLLKMLSRITEPTSGRAEVRGRVGSLLEVGTGFHSELTGRENIFLNGAILGMRRAEIVRRFDEIVAFAEVERFIDTPVKHYSTGMYLRLAFAVAAHLEPEILLVDEVLAVGDAVFQKKCLGKMGDVSRQGRTVVFVSHNMAAVRNLCATGILLDHGTIACAAGITECVARYMSPEEDGTPPRVEFPVREEAELQIRSIRVVDGHGQLAARHPHDEPFWLELELFAHRTSSGVYCAFHIHDSELATVLFSRDFESDERLASEPRTPGLHRYRIRIPAPLLIPGAYSVSVHVVALTSGQRLDGADHVCPFRIFDNGSAGARRGFAWRGKVSVPLRWEERGPDGGGGCA